ncbi:MAG: superoxide dismutase family protein [Luteimonas sp.]
MPRILSLVLLLSLAACSSAPPPRTSAPPAVAAPALATIGTARQAIAALGAASGTLVSGKLTLLAVTGGVRITGDIGGLARNGAHRLQLHERGDCSAVDAHSAGKVFDPTGRPGPPLDGGRDRIVADADGVAHVDLQLPAAVLGGGAANDIAGRALIVLGASSNATGARVACGVIKVSG